MLEDLVERNRSYRRFDANNPIPEKVLIELVELARKCPSGKNNQVLKYVVTAEKSTCDKIFPLLQWAGLLKEWSGPTEMERPTAYIIVVKDGNIGLNHYCDDGLAIQTMLLGAVEKGFGGCILGAFNKDKLSKVLQLSNQLEPLYVIALGKPAETVVLTDVVDNDTKYYRDKEDVHHVPKRSLHEIIIKL